MPSEGLMSRRSVVTLPRTLLATVVGVAVIFATGVSQTHAAQQQKIPETIRARSRQAARVRVLVELKLPSPQAPEASLRSAEAILAQRRAIADRIDELLAKLPP